jgi:nucleotide-binding universal stress UspA family protein
MIQGWHPHIITEPGTPARPGRLLTAPVTAGARLATVTTAAPSAGFLQIVVGYDGSPPATRALDAAVRLLQGRNGRIEVVWISHLSSTVMLSADAIAEMETSFEELDPELRAQAAGQLRGLELDWGFQRLQGIVSDELVAMAAGLHEAHPEQTVVVVVGSSSHAGHRMVGSVPVSLARHSPVPVIIVP